MSECEITGDAIVSTTYPSEDYSERRLHWDHADPEIHVAQEIIDDADHVGREFLLGMYEIGEPCPDDPSRRHARRRQEAGDE